MKNYLGRMILLVEDYDKAFEFTKRTLDLRNYLTLQRKAGKVPSCRHGLKRIDRDLVPAGRHR